MPSMNVFIESSQFKIENLKVIEEMFVKIKAEYEQIFTENEYLELEIREFLIRKLNAIDGKFGLDQYTEGKPLLEKMYETVSFRGHRPEKPASFTAQLPGHGLPVAGVHENVATLVRTARRAHCTRHPAGPG